VPFVYILRCADESLYIGHAEDVDTRASVHNDGRGARYTAARRPVRVVYANPAHRPARPWHVSAN
jgi:predicted GIY-YIG superfamily endonuclease